MKKKLLRLKLIRLLQHLIGENFDTNYSKKLWCQIVCFSNVGAKMSVFTLSVPNCLFSYLSAKLSICLLSANLSVFTI